MATNRYCLSCGELDWVEDVLSNDETSADHELVKHFVRGGLSQAQAEAVVCHRDHYLNTIYLKGLGPLHLGYLRSTC